MINFDAVTPNKNVYFIMLILVSIGLLSACNTEPKTEDIYKSISLEEYSKLIKSPTPVLIEFSAAWCGPCKMLAPILKELKSDKDLSGRIVIIRLDSDKHSAIFSSEQIQAFPTMIIYKNGKLLWRDEGYMQKEVLKQEILEKLSL